MPRVALLGADFAPSSLPPALRLRFFAAHLPNFGWEPVIVTTKPRHYEWSVDYENENLLPPELRVIRTDALPRSLLRRLGFGDIGVRSLLHHWGVLSWLCARGEIDLLCIPVPPYVPMILGRALHMQFGIPYVIDYIDPWVTDYYWKFPREQRPPKWALANALSRIVEPLALGHVGHITGVSQGTTDGVINRYDWLCPEDGSEIPYGGEPGDFAYLRQHPRPNPIFQRDDGLLHICSTGRGGADLIPALRAIFAAVRLGLERSPELFGKVRLHFVGTDYSAKPRPQVQPIAEEAGLGHIVDEHPGRVPYLDALQILLDAHVLLAVGSEEAHYTASKVFPYILAQQPLLAVFHEASSVITTLAETQTGVWVDFGPGRPVGSQTERIVCALQSCLKAEANGTGADIAARFEQFTARAMAGRLATAFDRALERK